MSTRSQRTADKSLNQKHAKILKACLDRPENKYCADCKKKGCFDIFSLFTRNVLFINIY